MSASTISPRRAFTSLALVVSALSATACSGFSSSGSSGESSPGPARGDDAGTQAPHAPQAPPITGTPDKSELNEAFGVFVAPKGQPESAGTREHPLATIQAGIDLGKRLGKRVYVCAGTFHEALVLADSISIIGGLDCSGSEWRIGGAHTRIEAPTSPAVRAKNLVAPTRLEGLDIVAPSATEPSGSSIGLIADDAAALLISASRIEAGNGAKGNDGVDGTQLAQTGTLNGSNGSAETDACFGLLCAKTRRGNTPGGTSVCSGAAGHDGENGGYGGSGGLYFWLNGNWSSFANFRVTAEPRSGGLAAAGVNGVSAAARENLSAEGYAPSNGSPGTDGAPGKGGYGGDGAAPTTVNPPPNVDGNTQLPTWYGGNGAGGGAGGCPGLAGTPGSGGGASIAVLVMGAAITLEKSDLLAHDGGAGGRGSLGSSPTPGGAPGIDYALRPLTNGHFGGNGGASGVSGSGAGGPSYGLAFTGTSPAMTAATAKAGRGGAGVAEQTSQDALGNPKTIPASAAGTAQDVLQP